MYRLLVYLLAVALLAGCKVKITVPEGGRVTTSSGAYSCDAGSVCMIDVVDIFFDETFIAEPLQGYKFKSWKKKDRGLCGGNSKPCRLITSGFEGNEALMAFLENDQIFYLKPVFQKLASCTESKEESTAFAKPDFEEHWDSARIRSYKPREELVFLRADAGTWWLADTVTEFSDCGETPHRAKISKINGSKALSLISRNSNSDCADNIFVAFQELAPIAVNSGFAIPVRKDTIISFDETGTLFAPQSGRDTCLVRPCGDTVSLTLQVLPSRSQLTYVLQRAPDAEPNTRHSSYREIFLDPDAGSYRRNLMNDLMTIPNFRPAGAEVRFIGFAVNEHGSATLDNLVIGEGTLTEACPR
jgi:hypothetical protein